MLLVSSTALDDSDSIDWVRGKWRGLLGQLKEILEEGLEPSAAPVRLHLKFTGTDAQKPHEGGCIFALSAAKKMAAEPEIAALHRETLQALADGPARSVSVRAANATRLLPPSFFKHATALGVTEGYIDARRARYEAAVRAAEGDPARWPPASSSPDAPVNRQGQTLMARFESHLVQRLDRRAGKVRTYSKSYETKRLEIIKTALAHLTAGKS